MEKPVTKTKVSNIPHMREPHIKSQLPSEPNIQTGCLSRMPAAVNERLSLTLLALAPLSKAHQSWSPQCKQ